MGATGAACAQYIARLVCRVVAVSVETVKLVGALAAEVGGLTP